MSDNSKNDNNNNNNNDQNQQQQQKEPNFDLQGNVVRGRAGNLMGMDRGPQRGGVFEGIAPHNFEASPQGASSSVEGWVMMIGNLSPNTTENDIRLFLSDVDPTGSCLDEGDNNENNNNNQQDSNLKFVADLKMNMSAANVACLGHAFVKTPKLEWAYKMQSLNGVEFVDELPVSIDFAFRVPPPPPQNQNQNQQQSDQQSVAVTGGQRDRGNQDDGFGPDAKPRQE